MKKVANMHEQKGNFSKETEMIRKNDMEKLEIKSLVIELQKALTLVDSKKPKKESVNFKDKATEITQIETQRKEAMRGWVTKQSIQEL